MNSYYTQQASNKKTVNNAMSIQSAHRFSVVEIPDLRWFRFPTGHGSLIWQASDAINDAKFNGLKPPLLIITINIY